MYPCVLDLPLFHSRAEALSLIFRQNPCALYIQTSRPRLFVVINVGFQCKTADGVAIGHHPIGLKFRPIFRREEVFWIRPEYFAVKIAQSSNIVRNNCLPELNCQFGPFCPNTLRKILSTFLSGRCKSNSSSSVSRFTFEVISGSPMISSRKLMSSFHAFVAFDCTRRYASSRSTPASTKSSNNWPLNTSPPVDSRFFSMRLG